MENRKFRSTSLAKRRTHESFPFRPMQSPSVSAKASIKDGLQHYPMEPRSRFLKTNGTEWRSNCLLRSNPPWTFKCDLFRHIAHSTGASFLHPSPFSCSSLPFRVSSDATAKRILSPPPEHSSWVLFRTVKNIFDSSTVPPISKAGGRRAFFNSFETRPKIPPRKYRRFPISLLSEFEQQ